MILLQTGSGMPKSDIDHFHSYGGGRVCCINYLPQRDISEIYTPYIYPLSLSYIYSCQKIVTVTFENVC